VGALEQDLVWDAGGNAHDVAGGKLLTSAAQKLLKKQLQRQLTNAGVRSLLDCAEVVLRTKLLEIRERR
jgi:hypothetical protein